MRNGPGWLGHPTCGGAARVRGKEEYFVYVLQSKTSGRYYIGTTCDVERRLRGYDHGKSWSVNPPHPRGVRHPLQTESIVPQSVRYLLNYAPTSAQQSGAAYPCSQIKSQKEDGEVFRRLIKVYSQENEQHVPVV